MVARRLGVVVLELHSACTSNQGRSHIQVVTPNQGRPKPETQVLVLRRIQCHYHPCWLDGKPRCKFGDLPLAFKETLDAMTKKRKMADWKAAPTMPSTPTPRPSKFSSETAAAAAAGRWTRCW